MVLVVLLVMLTSVHQHLVMLVVRMSVHQHLVMLRSVHQLSAPLQQRPGSTARPITWSSSSSSSSSRTCNSSNKGGRCYL